MVLLLLEALGALVLLVLIVWWTMFSGRKNGELPTAQPAPEVFTHDNHDPAKLATQPAEQAASGGKVEPTKARKDG